MSKLEDLKPNSRNPRTITDQKIAMLRKSMKEFGSLDGVIFNRKTNRLVGGHQRQKAFGSAQITIEREHDTPTAVGTLAEGFVLIEGERYPYREVEWDEPKEMAANIAANKGAGAWNFPELSNWFTELDGLNFDLDLTMFDAEERENIVVPIEHVPPEGDPDHVPSLPVEPTTKRGDIWKLGNHRLMCGDSSQIDMVEALMDGRKADVVMTDPPYNVASESKNFAVDKSKAMKDLSEAEWDKDFDITPALSTMMAVCSDSVTVYVWTSQFLIQKIWDHLGEWCDFTSYCVWAKPNPMPSLSKRHWTWNSELCVYATRGSKRKVNFPEQGHAPSVWTITKKSDGTHPTQKPVELIEHAILFSSSQGQLVLDLFGGSGTTLVACEKNARQCFMMELDPKYCDVIIRRWEQYTGGKAELLTPSSGTAGETNGQEASA